MLDSKFCSDKPNLTIGTCSDCDLTQVSDFSHVKLSHYSSDDYFPSDLGCARKKEYDWNRKRIIKIKELKPDLFKSKALDFGSGHGGFLEQGQDFFSNLIGFDVSQRVCKSHLDNGWQCVNRLEDIPEDIETIFMFHVLEHLHKPWALITNLLKKFKFANTFIIEVPNEREALISVFNLPSYQPVHYTADHVYYFSPKSLRRIVEYAGLKVSIESQMQRYSFANTIGWLLNNKGGGQNIWTSFNDQKLNCEYERVLTESGIADSIFLICDRNE